jgi:hypothetical protein
MTTRYRDGGISNQTATDSSGNGLLAELFPLFNWYVTEADTTRFKQTGVNVIVDAGGPVNNALTRQQLLPNGTVVNVPNDPHLINSMYQATAARPTGCDPTGGSLPSLSGHPAMAPTPAIVSRFLVRTPTACKASSASAARSTGAGHRMPPMKTAASQVTSCTPRRARLTTSVTTYRHCGSHWFRARRDRDFDVGRYRQDLELG